MNLCAVLSPCVPGVSSSMDGPTCVPEDKSEVLDQ